MAGYVMRTLPASGVHRDLFLRAAVLSSGDDTLCLLSAEVLSVDHALTQRVREAVTQELGIPPAAIMLAATHTHASVGGLTRFPVPGTAENVLGAYAPERVDHFVAVALSAARQAFAAQTDVTLYASSVTTEKIVANRRDASGVNDPTVPLLLAIDDYGVVRGILFSFACHPTILGADNRLYSGDLIGTACALYEKHMPPGGVAVGLTGAAGNISTRFTRRASTTAEVERMGGLLADALAYADLRLLSDERLACAQEEVSLPLKPAPDPDILQRSLAHAQKRLTVTADPQRRVVEAEIEGLQVQLGMGARPRRLTTEVQVFRVGSTYMISMPGELFVEYGLELVQRFAPVPVLIAGYADDYIGYVTTPAADDGYEGDSAIVPPAAGMTLLSAALTAARRCET
jgi:hypothetical protein